MQFQCDTASRTPIYRQLADQVRAAVARGRVQPGERLPSVRQLSRELVVNPNTVARAYTELEREGTLVTQQGRGVFVAEPRNDLTKRARQKQLEEQLDQLFVEAVHLGFSADELLALIHKRREQFAFTPQENPTS
ncbi:GntR family transcriptional regulator [Bythopirellula polymerisocia]|uniref:HTH-type transcriptional repressor YtrA n=1 Tax=Bythopirellula polymerisocia TaxID=2528003 RepID=A0A5C6CIV6_9BACT|nr:GntR family transcriptional regulator [Bythopirellula polymerisocia]TWU23587.1 HTH-type transcriptional repressor YtrA [Bythopirellula polymerisocia]